MIEPFTLKSCTINTSVISGRRKLKSYIDGKCWCWGWPLCASISKHQHFPCKEETRVSFHLISYSLVHWLWVVFVVVKMSINQKNWWLANSLNWWSSPPLIHLSTRNLRKKKSKWTDNSNINSILDFFFFLSEQKFRGREPIPSQGQNILRLLWRRTDEVFALFWCCTYYPPREIIDCGIWT